MQTFVNFQILLAQGRSQDFFRGTRNSPNRFAPSPRRKKTTTTAFPNYIQIWLRCKPKSFFCI